ETARPYQPVFRFRPGEKPDLGRIGIRKGAAVGVRGAPVAEQGDPQGAISVSQRTLDSGPLAAARLGGGVPGAAHGRSEPGLAPVSGNACGSGGRQRPPDESGGTVSRKSEALPPASVDDPHDISGDEPEQ